MYLHNEFWNRYNSRFPSTNVNVPAYPANTTPKPGCPIHPFNSCPPKSKECNTRKQLALKHSLIHAKKARLQNLSKVVGHRICELDHLSIIGSSDAHKAETCRYSEIKSDSDNISSISAPPHPCSVCGVSAGRGGSGSPRRNSAAFGRTFNNKNVIVVHKTVDKEPLVIRTASSPPNRGHVLNVAATKNGLEEPVPDVSQLQDTVYNVSLQIKATTPVVVPSPSAPAETAEEPMDTAEQTENYTAPLDINGEHIYKRAPEFLPKPFKKFNEKMRAEASVVQRINELQKEGMLYERRLPKVHEPPRIKAQWDYLLEEMQWLAADFAQERKWKRIAAKKCAKMIEKYFNDKQIALKKAERDETVRLQKIAVFIGREVRNFWSNSQKLVEYCEQSKIEELRKKARAQHLSFIVDQTEKFSNMLAICLNPETKDENPLAVALLPNKVIKEEVDDAFNLSDDDYELPKSHYSDDDEETIAKADEEIEDTCKEIALLQSEGGKSLEDLLQGLPPQYVANKMKRFTNHGSSMEMEIDPEGEEDMSTSDMDETISELSDDDDQLTLSGMSSDETDPSSHCEDEQTLGLASLLQTFAPENAGEMDVEDDINSVAAMAESFQPTGYTLSSTNVATKVPILLKHTLREYQHIGLDWLVTMCDKKLNGILADEMGLGKTIQTIALLAHLACEKGNWGPHLIIVPTSVMLNWEMEFKKWCPGFKILTYYGSVKERKLKRQGWTKPNTFHVCITSYKLVIQDHQSFRRKRWRYLILDEAQNIKNFKSQRWQLLLNFSSQRRLLLTGTPLQNNLMELWSLMHFLMPNVFQSHREFREWFSNPVTGMVEGNTEYNENIIKRLHKVLRPFLLRRLKCEVEKQLPQKYEHVIMCRLSKRQRFLYEEFMSRARTRDTLATGNLLSVINILMQLRKVCNHPNLFETRPIISPLQTEEIITITPSLVWNMFDDVDMKTVSYPIIKPTECSFMLGSWLGNRICTLKAPRSRITVNPFLGLEETLITEVNSETNHCELNCRSPKKNTTEVKNTFGWKRALMPNSPRSTSKLPVYVMSEVDPRQYFQDPEFLSAIVSSKASNLDRPRLLNGNDNTTLASGVTLKRKVEADDEYDEYEDSEEDLITTPAVKAHSWKDHGNKKLAKNKREFRLEDAFDDSISRKRKVLGRADPIGGTTWIHINGFDRGDFELNEIDNRRLHDRKAVIEKLQKLNSYRCYVHPFYGYDTVQACRAFDVPFPRGDRFHPNQIIPSKERDYTTRGYFNLSFGEFESYRLSQTSHLNWDKNHPTNIWRYTKGFLDAVQTNVGMEPIMRNVLPCVIYIPSVAAPPIQCRVFRPTPSRYQALLSAQAEGKRVLKEKFEIFHPIMTRMTTQFPDPRLIQYDCGKLQELDGLLRRLFAGDHRVLIFTQMTKMLDVLEAFLNFHGYIYLRLDGSTKIDQRQLLMEKFNTDKKVFCFILSTRSGGIGVNLTGADTVIFYDSDWNPTMDAQAQDRCHRIGQTRDVHIYRLVSERTVEENILLKSNQKKLLGELAIEGGNFTTAYFKKHTIRDLFDVQKVDANVNNHVRTVALMPRLSRVSSQLESGKDEFSDKNKSMILESALAAAEDETDVQAARTVRAEAAAELAEFDESIPLDDLNEGQEFEEPSRIALEMELIKKELSPVERYALRFMQTTISDWTTETYASAEKELEQQKREWEMEQLKKREEQAASEDSDLSSVYEMFTYPTSDAHNKVWIAQDSEGEFMPLWEPPTPPQDDSDVYIDACHQLLYDSNLIPEYQLPPIYVPPLKKKKMMLTSPKGTFTAGYSSITSSPSAIESSSDPKRMPPLKIHRREEPIFAPRSLFDRPSPAVAKLRRDYRLQKYNCRPLTTATSPISKSLGPGAVTFPVVAPALTKSAAQAVSDAPEWMTSEEYALLQGVTNMLELPLNLMIVSLAQTANWEFLSETVNMNSIIYRSSKQCKIRYEAVVGPREEGKIIFDTPTLMKKKKTKSFIKIGPPSPQRARSQVKTAQLMLQDNYSKNSELFLNRFDTIRNISTRKLNIVKPAGSQRLGKQSVIFTEHGISYDTPLTSQAIAQARLERIQLERRKVIAAQEAARSAAQAPVGTITLPGGQTVAVQAGVAGVQQQPNSVVVQQKLTASQLEILKQNLVMSAQLRQSQLSNTLPQRPAYQRSTEAVSLQNVKRIQVVPNSLQSSLGSISFAITTPASTNTTQHSIIALNPSITSQQSLVSTQNQSIIGTPASSFQHGADTVSVQNVKRIQVVSNAVQSSIGGVSFAVTSTAPTITTQQSIVAALNPSTPLKTATIESMKAAIAKVSGMPFTTAVPSKLSNTLSQSMIDSMKAAIATVSGQPFTASGPAQVGPTTLSQSQSIQAPQGSTGALLKAFVKAPNVQKHVPTQTYNISSPIQFTPVKPLIVRPRTYQAQQQVVNMQQLTAQQQMQIHQLAQQHCQAASTCTMITLNSPIISQSSANTHRVTLVQQAAPIVSLSQPPSTGIGVASPLAVAVTSSAQPKVQGLQGAPLTAFVKAPVVPKQVPTQTYISSPVQFTPVKPLIVRPRTYQPQQQVVNMQHLTPQQQLQFQQLAQQQGQSASGSTVITLNSPISAHGTANTHRVTLVQQAQAPVATVSQVPASSQISSTSFQGKVQSLPANPGIPVTAFVKAPVPKQVPTQYISSQMQFTPVKPGVTSQSQVPTQLIVQATPKQIQNALQQFQHVFKQMVPGQAVAVSLGGTLARPVLTQATSIRSTVPISAIAQLSAGRAAQTQSFPKRIQIGVTPTPVTTQSETVSTAPRIFPAYTNVYTTMTTTSELEKDAPVILPSPAQIDVPAYDSSNPKSSPDDPNNPSGSSHG